MPRAKKTPTNIDDLDQTHGSLTAPIQAPRSVDDLLGMKSGYTATSLAEYQKQLNDMTDIDLHDHAISAGVVPGINNTRATLTDRLERQFLTNQTRNVFKNVPVKMSAEAERRQKRFMQGAQLLSD